MGRSNPTYRDTLRQLEDHWSEFRRALRYRDQAHFDQLWEQAAGYADAAGYQNQARTFDLVLLSVLLAQEQRIAALEAEMEE